MTNELTQERLKTVVSYNPENGLFINKIWRGGTSNKGTIAGWVDGYGYIQISIDGKEYRAHRLAFLYMTGAMPKDQCDHINHVRADNRWCNLREVNNVENNRNQTLRSTNTSGATGITWHNGAKKWAASITVLGKTIYLGIYIDIEDAKIARKDAEKEYGFHENHGMKLTN